MMKLICFRFYARYKFFAIFALIVLLGVSAPVFAQTTPAQCRELDQRIKDLEAEDEKNDVKVFLKENEAYMEQNMSMLNKAVTQGTVLPTDYLQSLSDDLKYKPSKNISSMTGAEQASFQRELQTYIGQAIEAVADYDLKELRAYSDKLDRRIDTNTERFNSEGCREILLKEKKEQEEAAFKEQEVSIPTAFRQCEEGVCGWWRREGNKFHAEWENGAKAEITIVSWKKEKVVLRRNDKADSFSKNFSAEYTGRIVSNRIVDGQVTWTQTGRGSWKGRWEASW